MSFLFPVVPLCERQLRDVTKEDILENGLYRKCNVYKSGGGYDRFPYLAEKRLGLNNNLQFVVQLKGCPFKCHYCYVTEDGVNGKSVFKTALDLVTAYKKSGCNVFHLMGGAPALYYGHWDEIIDRVNLFHSDLMLVEHIYDEQILRSIAKPNTLYAVSIKGCDEEEYLKNTCKKVDMNLIKENLYLLHKVGLNFYVTFTGMSDSSIEKFKKFINCDSIFEDSFTIDLIKYDALLN